MPTDRPALLAAFEAAAIAAGDAILGLAGGPARLKPDASPVTEADEAAEAIILAHLASAAPGLAVVAEERCARAGIPECAGAYLLVDPLDGTREFVAGHPHYTVNIALVEGGRATMGVVSAPAFGRLWTGDVEAGAWARDLPAGEPVPIRARPRADPPVALASRCLDTRRTRAWLVAAGAGEVRRIGSSLKLCLIAEGSADLYPRHAPTAAWDIAAGQAVLEAAGGRIVDPTGRPLRYPDPRALNPSFVAAGAFEPPLP